MDWTYTGKYGKTVWGGVLERLEYACLGEFWMFYDDTLFCLSLSLYLFTKLRQVMSLPAFRWLASGRWLCKFEHNVQYQFFCWLLGSHANFFCLTSRLLLGLPFILELVSDRTSSSSVICLTYLSSSTVLVLKSFVLHNSSGKLALASAPESSA